MEGSGGADAPPDPSTPSQHSQSSKKSATEKFRPREVHLPSAQVSTMFWSTSRVPESLCRSHVAFSNSLDAYIYMHIYSGCYIHITDIYIYSGCYIQNMGIYIMDFGNLGTNVANGSIRILTLDITSRIYIQILVIWVPMLQMNHSEY